MKFPDLPTDNLYKFMALSGVVLFFLSFLPIFHAHKLDLESIDIIGELHATVQQQKFLKNKQNELLEKAKSIIKNTDKLKTEMPTKESLYDKERYERFKKSLEMKMDKLDEAADDVSVLKEESHQFLELVHKYNLAVIEVETKSKKHIYLRRMIIFERSIGAFCTFSGIVLALMGFWLWYKKLQTFQDIIVKKQAEK